MIILHHETPASYHYSRRSLIDSKSSSSLASASSSSSSSSKNSTLTEFQISQYQICLWTGIILFVLMLVSICSIINMEIVPDNLLNAKFQSGRTGKMD